MPLSNAEIEAMVNKAYGESPKAPEEKGPSTPGEYYTQYVGGPAYDYLRNFLNKALPGHPMNDFIAGTVAPETLTQAGVTAGTLLAPEAKAMQYFGTTARNLPKLAPIIDRLLPGIAGGAAGGLAEKGDPADAAVGAAIGAATGIPAEVASGVSRWYQGSKLAQRFFKEDPERLSRVVQKLVPEFGQIDSPANFGTEVWRGVAQDTLSDMYDRRMTAVADAVKNAAPKTRPPGQIQIDPAGPKLKLHEKFIPDAPSVGPRGTIVSPRITEMQDQGIIGKGYMTIDDLMGEIRDLRLKGRSTKGDPKLTLQGRQARDYAAELSSDLHDAIATVDPRLARLYKNTDRKYARGAEMVRYLKQPGIVDDNGKIDMQLLQAQMKEERAYGLSHTFSPEEFKDLMGAVFRGADATVIDDMLHPSHEYLRLHAGPTGQPHIYTNVINLLKSDKYAGNYDVDFLKPKGVAVGLQRAGAGLLKSLDQPVARPSAITLQNPDQEDEQP